MSETTMRFAPATRARPDPHAERLLHVDPRTGRLHDARIADLPLLLRAGDLLVVNDAATVPASIHAVTPAGDPIEIRLVSYRGGDEWLALLLGPGDWRTPTEHRLSFGPGPNDRLGVVRIPGGWEAIYSVGKAVQYSYRDAEVPIAEMQTPWAGRPWAVEMPSAGRPVTRETVLRLREAGVEVGWVTHAAGISSTGDPALDRRLPFPERYDVPEETVHAVRRARARGGRVVAAGTTVVRALEGAARAHGGRLRAGEGITDLRVGPGFEPAVVHGLLTGVHAPGESHFELLRAFAPRRVLVRALEHAARAGYLAHEVGDSMLVLSS